MRLLRPARPASIALGFLVATACIPNRNNPNDPAGAPAVSLSVVDNTLSRMPQQRVCGGSGQAVAVASRGRCLSLVVDTSGIPGASFQFSLVSENGQRLASPLSIPADPAHHGQAVLGTAFQLTLPVNVALGFQAVVSLPGHVVPASASLVLQNNRPQTVPDPERVIPVGGYPWAPGAPQTIAFDGSRSFDPDGDPLTYCWTLEDASGALDPANEVCSSNVHDPAFTLTVSTTAPALHIARLRVSDGLVFSAPVTSRVAVRSRGAWTVGGDDSPAPVGGLDPVFHDTGKPDLQVAEVVSGPAGEQLIFVAQSVTIPIVVECFTWPPSSPLTSCGTEALNLSGNSTFQPTRLAASPDGQGVWATNGNNVAFLPISGGTLGTPDIVPSTLGLSVHPSLVVDNQNDAWILDAGTSSLARIDTAGTVSQAAPPPGGEVFTSLAFRPAAGSTASIWTLQSPLSASGAGSLVRYTDPSSPATLVTDPALLDATGMAFVDGEFFWLLSPSRGLLLLDASLIDTSPRPATLDPAIVFAIPTLLAAPPLGSVSVHTDRAGRYYLNAPPQVVIVDQSGNVSPGGGIVTVDPSETVLFGSFPPGTTAVVSGPNVFEGLCSSGPACVNDTIEFRESESGSLPDTSTELRFGAMWATTRRPSLVRVAADGAIDEWTQIAITDSAGNPVSTVFPVFTSLQVSADGTTGWATTDPPPSFSADAIYAIDLTAGPGGTLHAVLADSTPILYQTPFIYVPSFVLAPMGPTGAQAWVLDLYHFTLSLLSKDGLLQPVFTLPVPEQDTNFYYQTGAATPEGGFCWVDSFSDATASYLLRYVPPGGGPSLPLSTLPPIAAPAMNLNALRTLPVAGVSTSAGDFCEVAYLGTSGLNTIDTWSQTGALVHRWTSATASVSDFSPVNLDETWVQASEFPTNPQVTIHVTFTGPSTFTSDSALDLSYAGLVHGF